ncbi:MAG: rod shape-determining protein MreC [Chitinispirillaceae bacterium]|nr:rod shape-determining protein MreC [Chitinispirillaceae bacterium]
MRWLFEILVAYRVYVSVFIAVGASLWMLSSPPGQQAKTARFLAFSIFYPFQISADQILRAKNIYAENKRLKNEVSHLYARLAQLREQAAENDRLRAMIGFMQACPYELIPVRVLARDPSPDDKSIVVTAGKNKGVIPYMAVVGENGVAGKVVQVMPQVSLVQLVTDPLNRVGIMVVRSRVVSILETENGREFFVHFRTYEEVAAGDTIVTSGLGGVYPKGFTVGTVLKVVDERDPLFKKAIISLTLDIDRMEELFVVKREPQWSSMQHELDSLGVLR